VGQKIKAAGELDTLPMWAVGFVPAPEPQTVLPIPCSVLLKNQVFAAAPFNPVGTLVQVPLGPVYVVHKEAQVVPVQFSIQNCCALLQKERETKIPANSVIFFFMIIYVDY
jgi:hypothetical protein